VKKLVGAALCLAAAIYVLSTMAGEREDKEAGDEDNPAPEFTPQPDTESAEPPSSTSMS
jgi:hypothetical protein